MDSFEIIEKYIKNEFMFNFRDYDDKFLERRIRKRMSALNMEDPQKYSEYFSANESEKRELVNDLAINVTSFFRDKAPYDIFSNEIIPKLIESKKIGDTIIIWSAGCASGEEPYSIAMLFFEVLGRKISNYKIKIIATDLNENALSFAKQGIYPEDKLKEMAPIMLERYFKKQDAKNYQIKNHLKEMIDFRRYNILDSGMLGMFDVIFCRNVVIYFAEPAKEQLFLKFYNSLNPGGFFIMGKTETMIGEARDKFKMYNVIERIYTK